MSSFLGDVTDIRILKKGNNYHIEIVDEYENRFVDYVNTYSNIPTQGEIIDVMCEFNSQATNTGFLFEVLEEIGKVTEDEVGQYVSISTDIYPDLNKMFIYRWREWKRMYSVD
jgi:hypothetical protein